MKTTTPLVLLAIVAIGLGPPASAGGKFSGGSGYGYASGTSAATGLGGAALSLSLPADQVIERTLLTVAPGTLTITDGSPAVITPAGDIRVAITNNLPFTWATNVTAPSFGGTAAGKVTAAVAYENAGKTLVIGVASAFAANDTLTVSGLSFTNLTQACRADRLALIVHASGIPVGWSDRVLSVTVPCPGGLGDGSDTCTMAQDKKLSEYRGTFVNTQ